MQLSPVDLAVHHLYIVIGDRNFVMFCLQDLSPPFSYIVVFVFAILQHIFNFDLCHSLTFIPCRMLRRGS
jgi:hypothetical protein